MEALASAVEYEDISIKFDPAYENIDKIIAELTKFISKHKLIIYGGLAIDYALRLHGDKIYADDLLQVDYDFMSPDSVNHAQEFGKIVYELTGRDNVRVMNAMHIKTMRVDIGDNHFLADVSYVPKDVFVKLPYLEYANMRIIHPNLQRIDMHSSLAFPYDNAPTEVIFHRWNKDIKRFNLLAKYYPIEDEVVNINTSGMGGMGGIGATVDTSATLPVNGRCRVSQEFLKSQVLNGFTAYGLYYQKLKETENIPNDIIPGVFIHMKSDGGVGGGSAGSANIIETYGYELDLVSTKLDPPADATSVHKYRDYINLVPERLCYNGEARTTIQSTKNKLLSVRKIKLADDKATYTCVSFQYLLKYFLGMYYFAKFGNKAEYKPEIYLYHYISAIKLLNADKTNLTKLSVDIYGNANVSVSKIMLLEGLNADLGVPRTLTIPRTWRPAKGDPEPFTIEGNPIYMGSGEEIMDGEV